MTSVAPTAEPLLVKVLFFPDDAPPEIHCVSATFESLFDALSGLVGARTMTYPAAPSSES